MTPQERSATAYNAGERAASIVRRAANVIIKQHEGHGQVEAVINDMEVLVVICKQCGTREAVEVTARRER